VIQAKEAQPSGQSEVKHDIGYSLESSATDTGFFNNLGAVMLKRVNIYKRSRKAFFMEAVVPSILMFLGTWVAKI